MAQGSNGLESWARVVEPWEPDRFKLLRAAIRPDARSIPSNSPASSTFWIPGQARRCILFSVASQLLATGEASLPSFFVDGVLARSRGWPGGPDGSFSTSWCLFDFSVWSTRYSR